MFVVMNRIPVNPAYADAFVARFQDRASLVDNMPGFIAFRLLRPAQENQPIVVVTHWEDRANYENWINSEEFKQGHAQTGQLPREAFLDHPKLELYEVEIDAARGEILKS